MMSLSRRTLWQLHINRLNHVSRNANLVKHGFNNKKSLCNPLFVCLLTRVSSEITVLLLEKMSVCPDSRGCKQMCLTPAC